ncbi:MAG: hypothetical protein ABJP79_10665 [Tateyamaria sp.]|uniref:hypothetical protein n=1 Tax=Tateyamaria sp. TaxID=1929288 RepID=UPI00329EEB6A
MKNKNISHAHSDRDLLCEVGRVATQWSLLEVRLIDALAALSGIDREDALCMFSGKGAFDLLEMMECWIGERCLHDQRICEGFNEFWDRANECRQWRNKLQHCIFERDEGAFVLKQAKKGKRALQVSEVAVTCSDVSAWAEEIVDLTGQLDDLLSIILNVSD